jgi:hypothetical protein
MRADDQKYLLESADRAMTALVDATIRIGFMVGGAPGVSEELSAAMQHVEEVRKALRFRTEVEP